MDLMQLRRNLMMLGGNEMVGELSKYEKITITPSSNAEISVSHNMGTVPKIVIFNSTQTFASAQYIIDGIINQRCGGYECYDTSGNIVFLACGVLVNETGAGNARAYLTSTDIVIRRNSASRIFNTNAEYTVEIYA